MREKSVAFKKYLEKKTAKNLMKKWIEIAIFNTSTHTQRSVSTTSHCGNSLRYFMYQPTEFFV